MLFAKKIIAFICSVVIFSQACGCDRKIHIQNDFDAYDDAIVEKIVETFLVTNIQLEFDENDMLPFEEIFNYFLYHGFFDINGNVRTELKQFTVGKDFHQSSYNIPAYVVDNFLTGKFNTEINRTNIASYNSQTDSYVITPFVGDYYFDIELDDIDFLENNIVKVSVTEKSSISDDGGTSHVFKLQLSSDFRFISHHILQ